MRRAHIVTVLERVGNVSNLGEANIRETQVAQTGASIARGWSDSGNLREHDRRCKREQRYGCQ
jgi:hypothetical protein